MKHAVGDDSMPEPKPAPLAAALGRPTPMRVSRGLVRSRGGKMLPCPARLEVDRQGALDFRQVIRAYCADCHRAAATTDHVTPPA